MDLSSLRSDLDGVLLKLINLTLSLLLLFHLNFCTELCFHFPACYCLSSRMLRFIQDWNYINEFTVILTVMLCKLDKILVGTGPSARQPQFKSSVPRIFFSVFDFSPLNDPRYTQLK